MAPIVLLPRAAATAACRDDGEISLVTLVLNMKLEMTCMARPEHTVSTEADHLGLYSKLRGSRAQMLGPDGKARSLPDSVHAFLSYLLGETGEGRTVTIFQNEAQLSTIDAARLLGVSRGHVLALLEPTKSRILWLAHKSACTYKTS
jgi:hypothetical protein